MNVANKFMLKYHWPKHLCVSLPLNRLCSWKQWWEQT